METIRDLQRQLTRALLDGDSGALDTLVSDDCRIIGPKGYFIPKAEWIEVHQSGDYRQIMLETHDEQIQAYGDTAIVWSRQRSRCAYRGDIIDGEFRVTHVWVHRQDRPQLAGLQFTATAPAPAAVR
jgi:hypothetical protein